MAQVDLIKLINDFKIKSLQDFKVLSHRDRTIFTSRLYKKLENKKYKKYTLQAIKNSDGIRFHYNCPKGISSIDQISTFLNKLSFYSDKSLITIPLKGRKILKKDYDINGRRFNLDENEILFGEIETIERCEYGGEVQEIKDNAYIVDKSSFEHLVEVIVENKSLLEKDNAIYFFTGLEKSLKKSLKNGLHLTTANFTLKTLRDQFYEFGNLSTGYYEEPLPLILLPRFSNVPAEIVIEIKKHEQELYFKFHQRLKQILKSKIEHEQELLDFMREIDNEVKLLKRRFEILRDAWKKKNYFFILSLSVTSVILSLPESLGIKLPILGGTTIKDYFEKWVDKDEKAELLKLEPFYIMLRIDQGK